MTQPSKDETPAPPEFIRDDGEMVKPTQDYQHPDRSGATWAERDYERHEVALFYGERP